MITYSIIVGVMEQLYRVGFAESGFSNEDIQAFIAEVPELQSTDIVIAKLPNDIVKIKLALTFMLSRLEDDDELTTEQNTAWHFLNAAESLSCAAASLLVGYDIFHGEEEHEIRKTRDEEYFLIKADNHTTN